ncbi:MAG: nucleotidyltransferase family protein [Gemmataceae bacterium]|nr:nucleotidyltransferase family protein [Gemmataceae bacterium]
MTEGSIFFENRGAVQTAMRRIARRLDELGIPYAVAGGMALFAYGYRRFTEDVDVIVTRQSLKQAHAALEGRGYLRKSKFSKGLRDTELGVGIDFLVTGEYPGDGKPKPITFPDPQSVSVELDGVRYVDLHTLVSLKLACGMSNPKRGRDLVDVQELVRELNLTEQFADQLPPFVRSEYTRIWRIVHGMSTRYVTPWRSKWLTADAKSLEEMASSLCSAAETLQAMRADGVVLDTEGGTRDDYALLVTHDPDVAKKYNMVPESDFFDADEEESIEPPKNQS